MKKINLNGMVHSALTDELTCREGPDLKKCPAKGEVCQVNEVCVNIPRSYQCRCKPGYTKGSKGSCVREVNECLESKDVCDRNAVCIDTLQSYECRCKAGYYQGIGKECIKEPYSKQIAQENNGEVEDDCSKNDRPCPENSVCVRKSDEKSECECIKGYEYNSETKTCEDIDECRKVTKTELGCDSQLICFNTIGSYYCACRHGYKNVKGKCEDVDECTQGLCGENMECRNSPGSYSCSCRKGYREEMYWCADVDECRGKISKCEKTQTCINAPGSYKCSCPKTGYNHATKCKETSSGTSGEGRWSHKIASFSGNSYLRFATPAILKSNASVSMWFTIRYDRGNGIIIYAEKFGHKNFLGLSLKNGYLELSFNMGSGSQKLQSQLPLVADAWHTIEVIFRMDKIGLSLNEKEPFFHESKYYSRPLDVDNILYIGGVPNAYDATPNVIKNLNTSSGIEGCIGSLSIGDVDYDFSYPGKHLKKQENIKPCERVVAMNTCALKERNKNKNENCGPNSVCTNKIVKYRCSCQLGFRYVDDVIRICNDIDECESGKVNCGKNAICKNTYGGYYCECTSGVYDYTAKSCQVSKTFPIKDGWFVHLGKCASASCKDRVDGRTSLQDCKERCMANPTCGMIKFRPSRSRCSLCQSSVLRKPHNGKPCTPENRYDFYIKANTKFMPVVSEKKLETTETRIALALPTDSTTRWIALRGLCVQTDSYNPTHIMTDSECMRFCEAEPGCVMAKFSSAASLCWLSKSRKIAPLGNGCDGKFRNIYDYFVKALDECDGLGRKCPEHSECSFEKDHRYCKCQDGFEEHGKKCKDINECALYKDLCGVNAHCVNTPGSYKCSCNRLFTGDGLICLHKKLTRHALSFGHGLASSS